MAIVINGSGTVTGLSAGGLPDNTVDNGTMADDAIGVAELSATGTASSSTFLRGDNSWQSAADATKLPLAGGTMTGNLQMQDNELFLQDNGYVRFGTSEDLQIYHDGSNSFIHDQGTGDLKIQSNSNIFLERQSGGGATMLKAIVDGAVNLYHDNTLTFNTQNRGISVTGNPGDSTSEGVIEVNSSTSGTGTGILFFKGDGSAIGRISVQGGSNATSYITSSDYRMKQDIADMDTVWDIIKGLQPRKFKWKSNVAGGFNTGFIAHEVAAQIPSSVSGAKDATQDVTNAVLTASGDLHKQGITESQWTEGKLDGKYASDSTWTASETVNDYQGIDTNKMIPYLVKGLKEAITKIETLEAKVEALENP